jgi:hypothetical protein
MTRAHGLLLVSMIAAGCRRAEPTAAQVCARAIDRMGEEEAELYRRMTQGGSVPPLGSAAKAVWAECAPVYKAEPCRDVHLRYQETPVPDRVRVLTDACRDAYCPLLPEPRPALCTRRAASFSETTVLWRELDKAILQRDLGPEAHVVIDALERNDRRVQEAQAAYFDAGSPAYSHDGHDGPQRATTRMIPKTASSAQPGP